MAKALTDEQRQARILALEEAALLYDVFYADNTFDRDTPLPAITAKTTPERAAHLREVLEGAYAICKNGDRKMLRWNGEKWVDGAAYDLGKKGGSVTTSPAKSDAARNNGKRGGRPKKKTETPPRPAKKAAPKK